MLLYCYLIIFIKLWILLNPPVTVSSNDQTLPQRNSIHSINNNKNHKTNPKTRKSWRLCSFLKIPESKIKRKDKMFGYTKVSNTKVGGDVEIDLEIGGSSTLYPGLSPGENQLRWGFIRKVYGIVATQLVLTTVVSCITILYSPVNEVLKANPGFLLFLMFLPLVCTYLLP